MTTAPSPTRSDGAAHRRRARRGALLCLVGLVGQLAAPGLHLLAATAGPVRPATRALPTGDPPEARWLGEPAQPADTAADGAERTSVPRPLPPADTTEGHDAASCGLCKSLAHSRELASPACAAGLVPPPPGRTSDLEADPAGAAAVAPRTADPRAPPSRPAPAPID